MKTISKRAFTGIAFIALMGLTFNACKKDATTAATASVTEADAVEMTSDAIVPTTAGMTAQLSASVSIYKTLALSCGSSKDSTLTWANASGAATTYSASLAWHYMLNCSGIVPNNLVFSFTGNSSYNGVKMSLTGTTTGGFTLAGLQTSATSYTVNPSYTRSGSTTSKIGTTHAYTSQVTITSSAITIDKTTGQILSGTATAAITGTSSTGSSFSFSGTITFNGGNTATLVLNSGTSYTLSW